LLKKHFLVQNIPIMACIQAIFLRLVRSDICIKNIVMKSDSILVNETKKLFNE